MENLDDFFENDLPEIEASQDVEIEETNVEADPVITDEAETETVEVTTDPVEQLDAETPRQTSTVPVAALTAERSKAREATAEVERLKAELARYQQPVVQPQAQQNPQQSNVIPDPYDDPQGYHRFMITQARQEVQLQNLNYSRTRAVAKYGQDTINEVADWAGAQASTNPAFEAELLAQPDPAEWVIAQKKRSDLLKSFEHDPDSYVRARAAELGFAEVTPVATEAQNNPARKPNGPASIVTASSRDPRSATLSPDDAFDAIFKNR